MVVLLLIFSGLFHTVFVCLFVFVSFAYAVSSLLWVGFSQLQRVGTTLQLQCMRFSLQGLLIVDMGSSVHGLQQLQHAVSVVVAFGLSSVGFSSCGPWAQQLGPTGLVALPHVESCGPGIEHVFCIDRQILNPQTTKEVLFHIVFHSGYASLHSHQEYTRIPFLHIFTNTYLLSF